MHSSWPLPTPCTLLSLPLFSLHISSSPGAPFPFLSISPNYFPDFPTCTYPGRGPAFCYPKSCKAYPKVQVIPGTNHHCVVRIHLEMISPPPFFSLFLERGMDSFKEGKRRGTFTNTIFCLSWSMDLAMAFWYKVYDVSLWCCFPRYRVHFKNIWQVYLGATCSSLCYLKHISLKLRYS